MRPKRMRQAGTLLAVLLVTASPASAKLYKWVDENGNVFYSDKIPPDQARERHQVLDERGLVRENVRRAKTPEELEAERREKQQQAERERVEREQAIRDQVLLETFASERDLVLAREDRLASVDSAINLASKTLADLGQRYEKLDSRMQTLRAAREPIPGNLAIDHKRLSEQMAAHRRALESRREERDNIVSQFETDLMRYRELRALRQ